jgi:hypothetical protein
MTLFFNPISESWIYKLYKQKTMKTAMGMALARIELLYGMKPDAIHWEMFKNDCMGKEKEQIIDAWEKGYSTGCVVGSNDYTNEDEQKDNGNYYYNQTYNQNK